jgi:hypothetical protein
MVYNVLMNNAAAIAESFRSVALPHPTRVERTLKALDAVLAAYSGGTIRSGSAR